MKIAVSASGDTLESLIDPLFGRCPFFIIVDPERMRFEAFENPNVTVNDAGIKSARFVASKGAEIVITGNCGPKAVQKLSEAGIEIIVGLMGTIRQVVETYKKGSLLTTVNANVE
jgi:predicted Fe-Mo cluster-binding NifX family protein